MLPEMSSSKLYAFFFALSRVIPHVPCQETDKATIDVEAPEDGILAKIIVSTL